MLAIREKAERSRRRLWRPAPHLPFLKYPTGVRGCETPGACRKD